MIVDRSFHIVIGAFRAIKSGKDTVTAHSQLIQYAELTLDDVMFAGAVTCKMQNKVKVYEVRLNSSTVNETHWNNRSLSEKAADGLSKAQYFERVEQTLSEKVEKGRMYWFQDYVSAVGAQADAAEELA